jgi:ABC-2 type transport system ATP-binding protein
MAEIEIKHLTKFYGHKRALKDISFSIEHGEIFGYLGPNGAGKTTTINCMMDFIKPTNGKVLINNLDANKQSTALKSLIGYVSSDVSLYDNWTGSEHLNFLQDIRGKSVILNRLIKDFQFDPSLKCKKLSTGNRQKLSIIMALMHSPSLLILDEPTRGLDPLLQHVFYDYLREFKQMGSTIFFSSHNLAEVEHVCDRVAIIKEGNIEAVESISEMKSKRMYLVTIEFEGDFPKSKLAELKAELIEKYDHKVKIKVPGDVNKLLDVLSTVKLTDLHIEQASLEEIFLEYYRS